MTEGAPPQDPGDTAPPPPPPSAPPPPAEPPPDEPAPSSGGAVSDNRNLWIVLSYLPPLFIIPLLIEKEDTEVQWHAKHGLVIMVAEIAAFVVLGILGFALSAVGIGCLGCFVWIGLWVAFLVVHVLCIVKGINGERFLIPGLSEFTDKF
jgi:uncharacterized membrane protein